MAKNKRIRNIHFIGVGGVGMSGIAKVAQTQGFNVSGSDIRQSYITDKLKDCGVKVNIGNDKKNIATGPDEPDVVVVSTAILDNNQELQEAKKRGIEIWHRAKMLSYLGRNLKTLAVSGTHGKTSTSSMLASTLDALGVDPTFLIGGVVRQYGTNAKFGTGEYYVVEADESDKSFTYLNPYAAIVTNIEADHLDHYSSLTEIYEKFDSFMNLVSDDGIIVVCGDDTKLTDLAKKTGKNIITYGFDSDCDCVVSNYRTSGVGCEFDIALPVFDNTKSTRLEPCVLHCKLPQNPGKHYAGNAASVLILLDALGFDVEKVVSSISDFKGIKRRFDLIGKVNDITVVDDYAHHSTEIAATVKAACDLDFNKVHVIWQPHRYSRAKLLTEYYKDEFSHAFDGADTVIFTEVYAAGEAPIPGVKGSTFLNVIENAQGDNRPETKYIPNRSEIVSSVLEVAEPGDLIITMGAGDITSFAPEIIEQLKRNLEE